MDDGWRWNTPLPGPGYYWVYHDHWMDEEPYPIWAWRDEKGNLMYRDIRDGTQRPATEPQNFNYWRALPVPERSEPLL
jgi:hypothetical protein